MAADRLKQVALGAAILAVAIVGMTALVVINRVAPPDPVAPALGRAGPVAAPRPALTERHVAATDVVKLRTARAEPTADGLRIVDRTVGAALGLEPDDVIVSFSGGGSTQLSGIVVRPLKPTFTSAWAWRYAFCRS